MKLYIANLSYEINESSLREVFEPYGNVTEALIPTDRATGRPRGFGFVTFDTPEAAKSAIDGMNGRELDGRSIKVSEARPKTAPGEAPATGASTHDSPRKNFGPDRRAGAFAARYRNRR